MAVPVALSRDAQTLEMGAAVPLFRTRLASGSNIPPGVLSKPQYAVAFDGRFLMNVVVEGANRAPHHDRSQLGRGIEEVTHH